MAVRTYTPMGQTPILTVSLTRDHLSAIGGLTPDGRLFMRFQDHSYNGPDVVRFLQVLLHKIPGNLLVIWDGAPIHRSRVVKAFLRAGVAKCIHLERLPAYAPELNPQKSRPHQNKVAPHLVPVVVNILTRERQPPSMISSE